MEVLIFPMGGLRCAVDARWVEDLAPESSDSEPDGAASRAGGLRADRDPARASRLALRVRGRSVVLRTGVPVGLFRLQGSDLVPVPSFVFGGGRRLVRAVFEHEGLPHLLLDEEGLFEDGPGSCT